MKEPIYFLNNKFVKKSKAMVSCYDMGFLRSYGVLEFLITYGGKPFRLNDHINRFFNSAKLIDLKILYKKKVIENLILKTLSKNKFKESSIWFIATGGIGPTSMIPAKKATLAILVDPYKQYPAKCYKKGVKIITFKAERLIPKAKSMVYTLAIKALKIAYKQNALEALYITCGKVTECMTSNFFIFKNGKLLTAKDEDVLEGITRKVVLDISRDVFPIIRNDISLNKVLDADEAFLTASNKEVMPVIQIDDKKIGNGKVGDNTKKLMKLFKKNILDFKYENI